MPAERSWNTTRSSCKVNANFNMEVILMLCLVTKHTRAGSQGKFIQCPRCGKWKRVWAFDWDWTRCPACQEVVQKFDWRYEEVRPVKQYKPYLVEAKTDGR